MGDAEPLLKKWEEARDDAVLAKERFAKAHEDFEEKCGITWSENIRQGVQAFNKEKQGHQGTTEMSHSPLFVAEVSEVMLCVASF